MKDKKEAYYQLLDNLFANYDDLDNKSIELINKFIFASISLDELEKLLCKFLNLKDQILKSDYNKYQLIKTIKELKE